MIHSSAEKDYKSVNTIAITFDAIKQAVVLFGKATFVMGRGYDDNKIFLILDRLKHDYVIRLKSNRKLLYHNKWTKATELQNRRKGKVKADVFYFQLSHSAIWFRYFHSPDQLWFVLPVPLLVQTLLYAVFMLSFDSILSINSGIALCAFFPFPWFRPKLCITCSFTFRPSCCQVFHGAYI